MVWSNLVCSNPLHSFRPVANKATDTYRTTHYSIKWQSVSVIVMMGIHDNNNICNKRKNLQKNIDKTFLYYTSFRDIRI